MRCYVSGVTGGDEKTASSVKCLKRQPYKPNAYLFHGFADEVLWIRWLMLRSGHAGMRKRCDSHWIGGPGTTRRVWLGLLESTPRDRRALRNPGDRPRRYNLDLTAYREKSLNLN